MGFVYASPDVMEEWADNDGPRDMRSYPLSRAEESDSDREQWLLTNTVYDAPDLTAAMNQRTKKEDPVMECVYASPEPVGWKGLPTEETEQIEPEPKKKRGLLSRLFGGKRK